jgi:PhoPQ-activated pathogenicity-related protein
MVWLSLARADLLDYVKKPDDSFSWKLKTDPLAAENRIYELHLVAQTWQEIRWEHQLLVFLPQGVATRETMLMMITGGSAGLNSRVVGMELARKCRVPVAMLFQIPNQPLLGGKKEDALIAETFVRYLESKDESWPLLFPMVKSTVRAMDALQEFSKSVWKVPVKEFIVTGASKRGWTSWLTAATGDPRVKAIVPMVIDVLNMPEQMSHQKRSFGGFSEMIHDYTERGLVPLPDTPQARRLWGMVDPYVFRETLTLPKLILLGNNDPYWTVDALNLYWDGLKGGKWIVYVPNAGHNLRQDGKDMSRAVNSAAVFSRHLATGKTLPDLKWKHDDAGGKLRLTVQATPAPRGARVWMARAATRDFRKAHWSEQDAAVEVNKVSAAVNPPQEGYLAFYAELDYDSDGQPYHLCTQMRVAGSPER